MTLLERHETQIGVFEPKWIRVWSTHKGQGEPQVYSPYFPSQKAGSWLYALQAAKTSATLYGIWLGHVYYWHVVSAAMQRTMHETLPSEHPVYKLLEPQSSYLIGFDYVLFDGAPFPLNQVINFAAIAPPSRIADVDSFLKLTDRFAAGRLFFDDDPKTELAKNGLNQADFTREKPWDCYPAAQNLLRLWDICERYMSVSVTHTYPNDGAVATDSALQSWMKAAADTDQGNIRGLPVMDSRTALIRVLTSLVYRYTAHGISNLNRTANPALTFVANFPPCLQREDIPGFASNPGTQELLQYLPNTGTIADLLKFYFVFVFSKPYVPLIPPGEYAGQSAIAHELPFAGGIIEEARNAALAKFRLEMIEFMGQENIGQWPSNIEL